MCSNSYEWFKRLFWLYCSYKSDYGVTEVMLSVVTKELFETLQKADHHIKIEYVVPSVSYINKIIPTQANKGNGPTVWGLISSKKKTIMKIRAMASTSAHHCHYCLSVLYSLPLLMIQIFQLLAPIAIQREINFRNYSKKHFKYGLEL